jgi:hypothetical protein
VLLKNGKLYADSQSTDKTTGEKCFNTNKLYKIRNKHYGVTGDLYGWERFQDLKVRGNFISRCFFHLYYLFENQKANPCFVICVDKQNNTVYAYNQRRFGWQHKMFTIKNTYLAMGSGIDHITEEELEAFYNDKISPEDLLIRVMELDEYSGGRIIIL